jgi:hypothetical protein
MMKWKFGIFRIPYEPTVNTFLYQEQDEEKLQSSALVHHDRKICTN